jgi:hypothetical protein
MNTRFRTEQSLHTGDRIRLIHAIMGVEVGTQGVVLQCFTFDPFYDICFDGYPSPRLVNKHDLVAAQKQASVA